jgi:ABC-2 type transport system ATP-binding protein
VGIAVEASHLTKQYPQRHTLRDLYHLRGVTRVTVLEDVSFHVERGQLFGLLGPNGAGKTTLIKIFCTLLLPDAGTAHVNGFDVSRDGKAARKSVGYIFSDERSFYWRLTGRQNLRFFATLNNLTHSEAALRVSHLLRLTGMESHADKMFKDYSTGMRQRLAIARGLLTDPEILFLDEPTRSLDPIAASDIRAFIRDRLVGETKRTVILASNNMHEAQSVCERIAILQHGRLKACGTLREIHQAVNGTERYALRVSGAQQYCMDTLTRVLPGDRIEIVPPGVPEQGGFELRISLHPGRENIADILAFLVSEGVRIKECSRDELSLDEVFSRIVD